jgi:cholestenol delta-isomerase
MQHETQQEVNRLPRHPHSLAPFHTPSAPNQTCIAMEDTKIPLVSAIVSDDPEHPFFPAHVKVPGYVATSLPTTALLTIFFGALAAILTTSKVFLKWSNLILSKGEVWTASWFILCGFIHLFFEGMICSYHLVDYIPYLLMHCLGYFSYNSLAMGSRTDLFGQLWKEYALSDSRYMTRDPFVICMESWYSVPLGPTILSLCLLLLLTTLSDTRCN